MGSQQTYGMQFSNDHTEPRTPSRSSAPYAPSMTPGFSMMDDPGSYAQKRSRNDSTVFQGPSQSRGFLHTNIVITDAATMQHTDLSMVLAQIMDRITNLEMQNALSELQTAEMKVENDAKLKELAEALVAIQLPMNQGGSGKKPPAKQDKAIKV